MPKSEMLMENYARMFTKPLRWWLPAVLGGRRVLDVWPIELKVSVSGEPCAWGRACASEVPSRVTLPVSSSGRKAASWGPAAVVLTVGRVWLRCPCQLLASCPDRL